MACFKTMLDRDFRGKKMESKDLKVFLFKKTGIPCANWKRISKVKASQGGSIRCFEDQVSGRMVETHEDGDGAVSIVLDSNSENDAGSHGGMLIALAYKLNELERSNPSPADILNAVEAVGFSPEGLQFMELSRICPFDMDAALALPVFASEKAVASILALTHYRVIDDGDEHVVEFSDGLGLRDGDNGLFFNLIQTRMTQLLEEHGLEIEGATENSVSVSGETKCLSSALHASGATWADGKHELAEFGFCFFQSDALDYEEIHGARKAGA